MSLSGIDETKMSAALDAVKRLAENLNASVDQTELRGLILSLNDAATNLKGLTAQLLADYQAGNLDVRITIGKAQ